MSFNADLDNLGRILLRQLLRGVKPLSPDKLDDIEIKNPAIRLQLILVSPINPSLIEEYLRFDLMIQEAASDPEPYTIGMMVWECKQVGVDERGTIYHLLLGASPSLPQTCPGTDLHTLRLRPLAINASLSGVWSGIVKVQFYHYLNRTPVSGRSVGIVEGGQPVPVRKLRQTLTGFPALRLPAQDAASADPQEDRLISEPDLDAAFHDPSPPHIDTLRGLGPSRPS